MILFIRLESRYLYLFASSAEWRLAGPELTRTPTQMAFLFRKKKEKKQQQKEQPADHFEVMNPNYTPVRVSPDTVCQPYAGDGRGALYTGDIAGWYRRSSGKLGTHGGAGGGVYWKNP